MVVHLILKTYNVECSRCKRVEECFLYKCEVDYRYDFETFSSQNVEKENVEEENEELERRVVGNVVPYCDTMIPLCRFCYHSDCVYTCEKHHYTVNTNCMCDYTYQSYNHSPVDYWCPDIGFRRVYDTECQYCGDAFYTCGRHPRSPHKKTVCAKCNIRNYVPYNPPFYYNKFKFNKNLVGLQRLSKKELFTLKGRNRDKNNKYIEKLNELEKPDEDGFVPFISKRQKRKLKKET